MTTALTLNTINDEPRMLDTDLAQALGFERPRKVRELITANRDELASMGSLAPEQGKSRGQEFTAYYLNEEQALLVCMFSRTANAQAVRKQVIETFMQVRRGAITLALPDFSNPAAVARAWPRLAGPLSDKIVRQIVKSRAIRLVFWRLRKQRRSSIQNL